MGLLNDIDIDVFVIKRGIQLNEELEYLLNVVDFCLLLKI